VQNPTELQCTDVVALSAEFTRTRRYDIAQCAIAFTSFIASAGKFDFRQPIRFLGIENGSVRRSINEDSSLPEIFLIVNRALTMDCDSSASDRCDDARREVGPIPLDHKNLVSGLEFVSLDDFELRKVRHQQCHFCTPITSVGSGQSNGGLAPLMP
jgi:hypothetical protein